MTEPIALFPGTFDPPTLGHLDIIERAVAICPKVIVAVSEMTHKPKALFTHKERLAFLEEITAHLPEVEVKGFDGLAVDLAQEVGASFLIRGLRAFSDFEYEFRMGLANRKLSGIETLFLMSGENQAHISSSLIREIGGCSHDLSLFVPKSLEERIRKRLVKRA